MTRYTWPAALAALAIWSLPAPAADTAVELKRMHKCCEGCAKEVVKILRGVEGVGGVTADQGATAAEFTAADARAVQKALDALAVGGFYGDTGGAKGFAFPDDSGVKPGKVKSLTVTGFHNSCGGCVKSFREAIKGVQGVAGDNAKAKVATAEVTGDFDAADLIKALNKAGFHVKVKD